MATGRFAPSPTGDLHLGNLRTAVLAWLWARHAGSEFVVRMEDLDRATSSRAHETSQLRDLAAIGLDWDGEVVRQSDRFARYDDAIRDLAATGVLYPCYCTRKEIAAAASAPNAPVTQLYPGTCRDLTDARRAELERLGRPPAWRVRTDGVAVTFDDAVLGTTTSHADDVVVRRNDGVPAYNLAVVVDDAAQGIAMVVRGDDLATSTPAQVVLQQLLRLPTPAYAHVPLVLSERGERLAKRDGAVTLADRAALGDRPIDVVRWMLAGAGLPTDTEHPDTEHPDAHDVLHRAATDFDPALLPRSPVVLSAELLARSLPSSG